MCKNVDFKMIKIILVMPTRRSPKHAPLSRVLCYFHPLQCPYGTITLFNSHGGGTPPPTHTHPHTPAHFPLLLLRYWLPRAKLCYFSAKSDRSDSRTRRFYGPRRCNLASMKFNAFAEVVFLRLPRSYRVAEKSDPIGSREPNCVVFQQNPIVVTAELDAPMDSDAKISQA